MEKSFLFAFHSALRCANIMNGRINAQIRFCKWKTSSFYCFWYVSGGGEDFNWKEKFFESFLSFSSIEIRIHFIPNLYLDSAGRRRKRNFLFPFSGNKSLEKRFFIPFLRYKVIELWVLRRIHVTGWNFLLGNNFYEIIYMKRPSVLIFQHHNSNGHVWQLNPDVKLTTSSHPFTSYSFPPALPYPIII